MKVLFIAVVVTCLLTSCSNYYKAALASTPVTASTIENLKTDKRYFILRDGKDAYAITNISFSEDQKTMQCTLDSLPRYDHRLYLTDGEKGKKKYKDTKLADEDESGVLNEVHVYVNTNGATAPGPYILKLDKVQKVEILEKDKAKTNRSHTLGLVLGITIPIVLVAGILAIIVASTPIL